MSGNRPDNLTGTDEALKRRPRDALKDYYGLAGVEGAAGTRAAAGKADAAMAAPPGSTGQCDINSASFDPDIYLSKLLRERSLTELMDKEAEMVHHIKTLDSDMQTLVYENYNKFISATDTIRKMKNDFKKMEDEMDSLTTNMSAITELSTTISDTLQDRRQQITKLSGVHTLLKKLQFLFELPTRLQSCIDKHQYSQAVRYYTKARKVLHQYQHMSSFHGIQQDCQKIVVDLAARLRDQFRQKDSTPKQLAECVDLLLQLNEPAEQLCDEFLAHARHKIDDDLEKLQVQLRLLEVISEVKTSAKVDNATDEFVSSMDVLEFVDCGCNYFLSNICLVIASYNDMFLNRIQQNEQLDAIALKKLVQFVNELMERYFGYIQQRVNLEKGTGDNTILVRALDRFHRRLQAMSKLLPDVDFSRAGTEIVAKAARDRVGHYLKSLQQHLTDCLTDVRQNLAVPRLVGGQTGGGNGGGVSNLGEILRKLHSSLVEQLKSVLNNLQAFIGPDITFGMKPYFRTTFCIQDVREGLVVAFILHIMDVSKEFCEGSDDKANVPSAVMLIMSRLCYDMDQSTIGYLLTLVDEQFMIEDHSSVTSTGQLSAASHSTAQLLLGCYVRVQGLTISQMLRKSVETRDCLSTIEPRSVRAVMKRVVEDVSSIDSLVGQLYEEGTRAERTSDSTRRSYSIRPAGASQGGGTSRSQWSYTPSTMDSNLMSNIQKLFSEKIEVFSKVEFSRVSVLTGIIKISLKTFLECVRLRTFGRYGLQQIQVDTHYLQIYLWRFVSDENLVHLMLDDIVGSTLHRCLDPVPMESSVVELICERG